MGRTAVCDPSRFFETKGGERGSPSLPPFWLGPERSNPLPVGRALPTDASSLSILLCYGSLPLAACARNSIQSIVLGCPTGELGHWPIVFGFWYFVGARSVSEGDCILCPLGRRLYWVFGWFWARPTAPLRLVCPRQ